MSQNSLSRPDDTNGDEGRSDTPSGSKAGENAGNGWKRRKGRAKVASVEECLGALTQLSGLLLMGMLTPAQANAIRAAFATVLQHHQKSQSTPINAPAKEDLVKAVRNNPELASLLEPFLTDEQLQALMRDVRDAGDDGDG